MTRRTYEDHLFIGGPWNGQWHKFSDLVNRELADKTWHKYDMLDPVATETDFTIEIHNSLDRAAWPLILMALENTDEIRLEN